MVYAYVRKFEHLLPQRLSCLPMRLDYVGLLGRKCWWQKEEQLKLGLGVLGVYSLWFITTGSIPSSNESQLFWLNNYSAGLSKMSSTIVKLKYITKCTWKTVRRKLLRIFYYSDQTQKYWGMNWDSISATCCCPHYFVISTVYNPTARIVLLLLILQSSFFLFDFHHDGGHLSYAVCFSDACVGCHQG